MCVYLPYVHFLFPSRYTTSSIRLHTYFHGRTIKRSSTATSRHQSAQQNELSCGKADTFLLRRMSFSCGKACPLVAVEARLMMRPWTYVCRRIELIVYLEGKRERILFHFPSGYTTSSIRLHTYVHGHTIKRASTATTENILHSRMCCSCGKACPLVAVEARLIIRPWRYV